MAVYTMADAKIYIGGKTNPADLAAYKSDTYVEIGEVETFSALTDVQNFTQFTALNNSRARNLKTTKAAENVTITCGFDPDDAGQDALRDAAADSAQANYNFKIVYNDGDALASPPILPTSVFFGGLVGNDPYPGGGAEDVGMTTYTVVNNTGFTVEFRA
jgi:hypothetical protein